MNFLAVLRFSFDTSPSTRCTWIIFGRKYIYLFCVEGNEKKHEMTVEIKGEAKKKKAKIRKQIDTKTGSCWANICFVYKEVDLNDERYNFELNLMESIFEMRLFFNVSWVMFKNRILTNVYM